MKKRLLLKIVTSLLSVGLLSTVVVSVINKKQEAAVIMAESAYNDAVSKRDVKAESVEEMEKALSALLAETESIRAERDSHLEAVTTITGHLDSYFLMLVNKENKLDDDFVPADLVAVPNAKTGSGDYFYLNETCLENLLAFREITNALGYKSIYISAYRSIEWQQYNWNRGYQRYLNAGYSPEEALEITNQHFAIPGHSEHHTGLAVDINENSYLVESLEKTAFFKYAIENIHNYGFILRYPKDKQDITGYTYEPWHFRYVGVEHATYMKEHNLCLEEYIELLNSNLAEAQDNLAAEEADLAENEAEIEDLREKIDTAKEELESLQNAVDEKKAALDSVKKV